MNELTDNPFDNPYSTPQQPQQQLSPPQRPQQQPAVINNDGMGDYNPFVAGGQTSSTQSSATTPALIQPSPPAYSTVIEKTAPAPVPGTEELLRRQAELDQKAEELRRREEALNNTQQFNPRENNWPPLPAFCPIKPCFYQDFAVDINQAYQQTVKMIYYLLLSYYGLMFLNFFFALVIFWGNGHWLPFAGKQFGMSLIWMMLFTPCATVCWYRPAYKAFKTDSSINFFIFFFIMGAQICASIIMCVGFEGSGFYGWLSAFGTAGVGGGYQFLAYLQAILFTAFTSLSVILFKRIHSMYRTTGASFEKAQTELASGVATSSLAQQAVANVVVNKQQQY